MLVLIFSTDADIDEVACEAKGCVWDSAGLNVKCYLPTGSSTYGYQVVIDQPTPDDPCTINSFVNFRCGAR